MAAIGLTRGLERNDKGTSLIVLSSVGQWLDSMAFHHQIVSDNVPQQGEQAAPHSSRNGSCLRITVLHAPHPNEMPPDLSFFSA